MVVLHDVKKHFLFNVSYAVVNFQFSILPDVGFWVKSFSNSEALVILTYIPPVYFVTSKSEVAGI